jgi:hypothetical protein
LSQQCNPSGGACTDFVFDPVNLVNKSYTLLDDSNMTNGGSGSICRHNNFNYGTGALPGNYRRKIHIAGFEWLSDRHSDVNAHSPPLLRRRFGRFLRNRTRRQTPSGTGSAPPLARARTTSGRTSTSSTASFIASTSLPAVTIPTSTSSPALPARAIRQEAINYGNWYAYYRTRSWRKDDFIDAFRSLTISLSVHNLSNATAAPIWVNVGD